MVILMNKVLFSHKSDEWETPIDLFNNLNKEYKFTLDPCSTDENCKCKKHYTIIDDGLSKSWINETVFCNPPYSNIQNWVKKCDYEFKTNNVISVMLIPARTDTKWFHDDIYKKYKVDFIKGRLKFSNKGPAPFPSMIVYFDKVGDSHD